MAGGYSDKSRRNDFRFDRLAGEEEYSSEYFNNSDIESDLADYGVYPVDYLSDEEVNFILEYDPDDDE